MWLCIINSLNALFGSPPKFWGLTYTMTKSIHPDIRPICDYLWTCCSAVPVGFSQRFLHSGFWDLLWFSYKSISEVLSGCWAIRPGSQWATRFSPKVLDGVEVRALYRPINLLTLTNWEDLYLNGADLVHRGVCVCVGEIMIDPQGRSESITKVNHRDCFIQVLLLLVSNFT